MLALFGCNSNDRLAALWGNGRDGMYSPESGTIVGGLGATFPTGCVLTASQDGAKPLGLLEEFSHRGGSGSESEIAVYAQIVRDGAKQVLVLVERRALESGLHVRTSHYHRNPAASVGGIGIFRLIEDYDQQSPILELRACE